MGTEEGIRTFFSSMAEGIKRGGQWRYVFDFMRDNLRELEAKGPGHRLLSDLVVAGQIKMAADLMGEFGRWPCKEYKEKYGPRVDAIYKAAMAAKKPK
jgi:hypothetical protein